MENINLKTAQERIDALFDNINCYQNSADEYPPYNKYKDIQNKELDIFVGTRVEYQIHEKEVKEKYKKMLLNDKKEWNEKQNELGKLFKNDLEEYFNLKGHPKADQLYFLAWNCGHESGHIETFNKYSSLVDFIKD